MFLSLTAAVFLFGLDYFIKGQVDIRGKSGNLPASLCHGLFRLRRVENPGMVLGLGRKNRMLVKLLPFVVLLAVSFLTAPKLLENPSFLFRLGYGLVLGGGGNNLYDHWKRGYVIDYISLPVPKIRNIYFNLSDFGIFIGTALLCFYLA